MKAKMKVSMQPKTLQKTIWMIVNWMNLKNPKQQEQDLEEPSNNQDVLSKTSVQACSRPTPRQNKDIISVWKKWDALL
jgi:hypothetical protein